MNGRLCQHDFYLLREMLSKSRFFFDYLSFSEIVFLKRIRRDDSLRGRRPM